MLNMAKAGFSRFQKPSFTPEEALDRNVQCCVFLLLVLVFILATDNAVANTDCTVTITNSPSVGLLGSISTAPGVQSPICNVFLTLRDIFGGVTGKVFAMVAIAIAALMAFFGKLTWVTALIICAGIGVLFGASSLITHQGADTATLDDANPITAVFDTLQNAMASETGRAIGIVCAITLALGAIYGKISWISALLWTAGLGGIFGATSLVNVIWRDPTVSVAFTSLTAEQAASIALNSSQAGIYAPFMGLVTALISPGGTGVMVGSVSVIALGILAMLGKISWPRTLLVIIGIALFYGAMDVVYILETPLTPCVLTSSDPFTNVVCSFMEELQGPLGKLIATMAVMIVGVMSMMGKISWELGFVVTIGVALIFGANGLVQLFELGSYTVELGGGKGNWIDVTTCSSPAPSAPSTGNAIGDVLCYMVNIIYGPAGKALAMIAVIMMGFGALLGKVSFSQAFVVAIGIAVTFGAPSITGLLLPSADISGCTLQNPAGAGAGTTALAGNC